MTYPPGSPQQHPFGGPPPSQGYPQQQYAAPASGPGGLVMLDCSYNKLGFFLAFTGPHVRVDGYGRDGTWGQTPIPLPPGTHRIEVHTRYMGQMGPAGMLVNVYPGQQVPVFYRAPTAIFFKGAIGHQPQSTPGIWMTWALFAIAILILASTFFW